MMPDLKPCPFCGGEGIDIQLVHLRREPKCVFHCKKCKAYGPDVTESGPCIGDANLSERKAMKAWNRRIKDELSN